MSKIIQARMQAITVEQPSANMPSVQVVLSARKANNSGLTAPHSYAGGPQGGLSLLVDNADVLTVIEPGKHYIVSIQEESEYTADTQDAIRNMPSVPVQSGQMQTYPATIQPPNAPPVQPVPPAFVPPPKPPVPPVNNAAANAADAANA